MGKKVLITHQPSGEVLADGPLGWGVMPFEGNYYIRKKYLKSGTFKPNFIPGICIYKFLYVWLDLILESGEKIEGIGWLYWLPNPLFPFIWFRVAIPGEHSDILVERYD